MDHVYDDRYLDSVRNMKAMGFEVFLLNASGLRARLDTEQGSARVMGQALRSTLRDLCDADLSLTQCSIDRLVEREKSEAPGKEQRLRKTVSQTTIG